MRFRFVDVFRGLLMIHMALDHASLYWNRSRWADEFWSRVPEPADIANLIARLSGLPVAPAFSFMAGFMIAVTSVGRRERGIDEAAIRNKLIIRGLILIVAEALFFSLPFGRWQMGVLTCLGACIILLAFLRRLPPSFLTGAGLAIVLFHPLLRAFWSDDRWFRVIHHAGIDGGFQIYYPLIPWLGVMLLGFVAGRRFVAQGPVKFGWIALVWTIVYVVFRLTNMGAATHDPLLMSKYPPDVPWLAASLAVIYFVLWILPKMKLTSPVAEFIATYGRVPVFFYLIHFALLELTHPAVKRDLLAAVGVWAALLFLMFMPCQWYFRYRETHPQSWVRYL